MYELIIYVTNYLVEKIEINDQLMRKSTTEHDLSQFNATNIPRIHFPEPQDKLKYILFPYLVLGLPNGYFLKQISLFVYCFHSPTDVPSPS
jgi:hypothetical protein